MLFGSFVLMCCSHARVNCLACSLSGVAKICDFGLASPNDCQCEAYASYNEYCAPELLQKHRVSPSADVYAFGMVVHKIFTNRLDTERIDREWSQLAGNLSTINKRLVNCRPGIHEGEDGFAPYHHYALVKQCLTHVQPSCGPWSGVRLGMHAVLHYITDDDFEMDCDP
mmetsp:Transcript_9713/g.14554  ORF Transcript_9713/g.14554 Transcript_9713/m.14554 type:complete len:169 (+) Transcript_9713:370-876(+)